jgi:hypothetical protein
MTSIALLEFTTEQIVGHLESLGWVVTLSPPLPRPARVRPVIHDPWVDVLRDALGDREGMILPGDAWRIATQSGDCRTPRDNRRLGQAMRALGFARKKIRLKGMDRSMWAYQRGATPEARRAWIEVSRALEAA